MHKLLFAALFGIISLTSCAQSKSISTRNKKAIKYFQAAEQAFNFGKTAESLEYLKLATEEDPEFTDAFNMLGIINMSELNDQEKAIEYFQKVLSLDKNYNPLTYLNLGESQFLSQQYSDSKKTLDYFVTIKDVSSKSMRKAELISKSCDFAMHAMENPVPYEPVNAGISINSPTPEYFPALTADDQYLYFSRETGSGRYAQEDILVSEYSETGWSAAKIVGPPVTTEEGREGAHTISPDGKYLIFTSCDRRDSYGGCDLYITKRVGGEWGNPRNLGPNINTGAWETQPSISSDGRSLYFISNRRGGMGKADVYVSHIMEKNGFGKPINMGPAINSAGQESRPFIHPDNATLYFATDGRPGMGMGDIFISRKNTVSEWQEAENLGYPINTSGHETGIFVTADGSKGYIASDREDSYGKLDIYYFDLPENARPSLVTYVKGNVFDFATKNKLQSNIEIIDLENGETIAKISSDPVSGQFLACLTAGKNYACNVSKPEYLFHSENFSLENMELGKPFLLDIGLKKVSVGEVVILKNIFFETGKFDLKEESKVELNSLIDLLNSNQSVSIEIGGHTDNVGSDTENMTLSDNRAKSVYEYLIANQISGNRLSYKGYGETAPISTNETEEGRAENRRTEFKVIGL